MKKLLFLPRAILIAIAGILPGMAAAANPVVRFHTDIGDIDVVLLRDDAPNTVANFLGYVNRRDYDNSFIHRSATNFVIQGGGYRYDGTNTYAILQQPAVANEFKLSNIRGTLAMAKISGNPNSATTQWFFNLADSNAPVLDVQNGGYTVFGRILNASGFATLNTITAVPVYNLGSPFNELPLKNYSSGAVQVSNLVNLLTVRELPPPSLVVSRPTSTTVRLLLSGVQGTAYPIQTSTTLLDGSFSPLAILTTDGTGSASYEGPSADPRRFFRMMNP